MMSGKKNKSSGFTLITTLMLLFLLSGLAIAMLMMVNTEVKVGTQDVQNNITFHASEGAIEKMTADIANLFTNTLSPNPQDITTLATNPGPPALSGISFPAGGYTLQPITNPPNCNGTPPGCVMVETPGVVQSGTFSGLNAELLQVNLQATAQGLLGDETQMSRTVEVAMIPVFQFGIFSDSDLGFFNNPTMTFNGRIHTNGDLYLGCVNGATCTFTNKISAYGNVVRANIPNGLGVAAIGDQGNVQIPGAANGCSGAQPECTTLPIAGDLWGSVVGAGGNAPASAYNSGGGAGSPSWVTLSQGTWTAGNKYLGGMMIDGNYGGPNATGATNLSLPFVQGAAAGIVPGLGNPPGPQNFEIVRRPPPGEVATSPLGASRLYNEAAIRILLSDRPDELPGGAADADNVRLANILNNQGNGNDYRLGVQTKFPAGFLPVLAGGQVYTTYFATASTAIPNPGTSTTNGNCTGGGTQLCFYSDWVFAPRPPVLATEYLNDGNVPLSQTVLAASGVTAAPATLTMQKNSYPWYTPVPTLNTVTAAADSQWNLIDGYLRVEFLPQNGACPGPGAQVNGYCAITREWLQLGFARGTTPPIASGVPYVAGQSNPVNPYAILMLQQPAKRNTGGWNNTGFAAVGAPDTVGTQPTAGCNGAGSQCDNGKPPETPNDLTLRAGGINDSWNGSCTGAGTVGTYCAAGAASITAFNWYPINFYDAREGEPNDVIWNNNSCTPQGVVNTVELDVGNLRQWLLGNIPGSGNLVNNTNQNGYVLYFSDRRGMLPNPNGTQTITGGVNPTTNISGDAGFEDVVNSGAANRAPDGALEGPPFGRAVSPEDANLNNRLDNFGAQNIGLGFGYLPTPAGPLAPASAYPPAGTTGTVNAKVNTAIPNVYLAGQANRMFCSTAGATAFSVVKNAWVSGARHGLKLVDGSLGNVPTIPGGVFPNSSGGFTVGSENPVYVLGNYNSNCPAAAGYEGCTTGNANYATSWPAPFGPGGADEPHSAASIVADTVTLLSNNWLDWNSILLQPTQPCPNGTAQGNGCNAGAPPTSPLTADNRAAATTWYRMAIATGDVQSWPFPGWAAANDIGIGTDGGVGNFLRFLESWGAGGANVQTLNYNGSMVNLFYSTYNTGLFKCCEYSVYFPPKRDYNFDTDFTTFSELPPGTPMFRDIDNLNYRQSFTACTVGASNTCTN
jgi:hypothetical protein